MSEAEWLACTDPRLMLEFLGNKGSKRKLRLFIADGVKTLALIFEKDQEALADQEVLAEMHERVAEGQASEEDLERFLVRNMPELWDHRAPGGNLSSVWDTARTVVQERLKLLPLEKSAAVTMASRAAESADMCRVLRCIFGNPFQPVSLDPAILRWKDSTIVTLAQGIYAERAFDRLPILADALEEAGCTNADILAHCRRPGAHVRGCWAVDLLLGKE
jgi:hypothetical protein